MVSILSNKNQSSIVSIREVSEGGNTQACSSTASGHRGLNNCHSGPRRLKAKGTSSLSSRYPAYETLLDSIEKRSLCSCPNSALGFNGWKKMNWENLRTQHSSLTSNAKEIV